MARETDPRQGAAFALLKPICTLLMADVCQVSSTSSGQSNLVSLLEELRLTLQTLPATDVQSSW